MSNIVCPGCQAAIALSADVTAPQVCEMCGAEFVLQAVLLKAGPMIPPSRGDAGIAAGEFTASKADDGTFVKAHAEESQGVLDFGAFGPLTSVAPSPSNDVGDQLWNLPLTGSSSFTPPTADTGAEAVAAPVSEFAANAPTTSAAFLPIPITAATVASDRPNGDVARFDVALADGSTGGSPAEFVGAQLATDAIGLAAGEIPVTAEPSPSPDECSTLQCAVADAIVGDGQTTSEMVTAEQAGAVVVVEALTVADDAEAVGRIAVAETESTADDPATADDPSNYLATMVTGDDTEQTSIARARRRQGPGPIAHFIGVVGGAVVGLAIAYYALNLWDSKRFNFLNIWLPGIQQADESGQEIP